jgi:hypothetical protein
MKKIVVTPAGRRRYLEVLLLNLIKNKQDFDEWYLWLNTTDIEDINFCKKLETEYSWIKTVPLKVPYNGNLSIHTFFSDCIDSNTVYLRLDDDIVYLDRDFCKKMFEFRINNPAPFLVYGNIINNACISHLHQKNNSIKYNGLKIDYSCMGNLWQQSSANHVENIHREFINSIKETGNSKFLQFSEPWYFSSFERVSINCISWLGSTFKTFEGKVGWDEEQWLSVDHPKNINNPNVCCGEAVCSHFSFFTQRDYLDRTNILELYKSISDI